MSDLFNDLAWCLQPSLTPQEIVALIKYDLEVGVECPERHIIRFAKRIAEEQRKECVLAYEQEFSHKGYERGVSPTIIANAKEPKL